MGNDGYHQAAASVVRWEDALRTRTGMIAQQLVQLSVAASELPRGFWPAGGFTSIVDVTSWLSNELGRVNAAYLTQRRRSGLDEEQALQVVVAAELAVDAIGRIPAVATFLVKGANVEGARLKFACRMLLALLDVSVDGETTQEVQDEWRAGSGCTNAPVVGGGERC
jgi:hypothetical protein